MKKAAWAWIGIGVLTAAIVAGALWTAGRGGRGVTGGADDGKPAASEAGTGTGGDVAPNGASASEAPTVTPKAPSAPKPTVAVPVAPGAKLVDISVPPTRTLGFLERKSASANSTYTVEFEVYGWGPGPEGSAVVALVKASTPATGVAKPYDFRNRNVLMRLSFASRKVVTTGGVFSGTLVLRAQEGMLVPWLADARRR